MDLKTHSLYKNLDAENVITNTFTYYWKNFWVLFISSLIGILILQMFLYHLGFLELFQNMDPYELERNIGPFLRKLGIVIFLSYIIYAIINSFIIKYLIYKESEEKISRAEIFLMSLKENFLHMFFFLIVATMMIMIGSFAGIVIFIIGFLLAAIYLGTSIIAGGAIVVAENKNAFEAIGRSFILSHKDFWNSLGTFVLFVLIILVLSIILSIFTFLPYATSFIGQIQDFNNLGNAIETRNMNIGVFPIIINSIISALTFPLTALFSLNLYFKLKYNEDQQSGFNQSM